MNLRRPAAALLLLAAAACSVGPPRSAGVQRPRPLLATAPAQAPGPAAGAATPAEAPPTPTVPPGTVLAHGPRTLRRVALTFDSNLTPFMIKELDAGQVRSFDNTAVVQELVSLRVPATFFLAGLWMRRYPQETARVAAVPFFEVGSHSYSHRGFAPHCYGLGLLPEAEMAPDIERSEALLAEVTPRATRLFRFPGGCLDAVALKAATAAGVIVVQYDVASGDAFGSSVRSIVDHTLGSVRNGSIVVLHVTGGNTAPLTAQALPAIVTGLRARGFELVTVSTLIGAPGPRL